MCKKGGSFKLPPFLFQRLIEVLSSRYILVTSPLRLISQ